ncbi:class F sortase [Virgibacillus ihumii]|uniref:class F sortase n=1 Tax=Virgibacillus ihumii TaxID=2686091 RepID=UPI00157D9A32|nr:class F sortase [Virgibacillus ihumii]
MRILISILVLSLMLIAGCGQSQSTDSSQTDTVDSNTVQKTNEQKVSGSEVSNNNNKLNTASSGIDITKQQYGITPETIKIPAINVESEVEKVGLLKNGQMAVPENFRITGWYKLGPKPGERGSAVIAGHVDDKTGPGVFFNLKDLQKGDEVKIKNKDGKRLVFEVVGKEIFPMDDAPVKQIFGYTSRRMLNLVTCTGPFDRSKGGHINRLVVYTELQTEK